MSHWWRGPVVTTESGVYQPPPRKAETVMLAMTLLAVGVSVALGRASSVGVWAASLLIGAWAITQFKQHRRYGALGRPYVALHGTVLTLALPQDTRGQADMNLTELQAIIVYGRAVGRTFRFIRHDGTYVEMLPGWSAKVEQAAQLFLRAQLPTAIRFNVEAPQSVFATVRADGPYTKG
jgi:hypothetical protein